MGDGLVAILENKIKDQSRLSDDSDREYFEDYVGACGWTKIYDQRELRDWINLEKAGPSSYNPNIGTLPMLEVVGERIKPKQERHIRKLDRIQNASINVVKIQRLMRGKLARKKAELLRQQNAAAKIQRRALVFLARLKLENLRK